MVQSTIMMKLMMKLRMKLMMKLMVHMYKTPKVLITKSCVRRVCIPIDVRIVMFIFVKQTILLWNAVNVMSIFAQLALWNVTKECNKASRKKTIGDILIVAIVLQAKQSATIPIVGMIPRWNVQSAL